MTRRAAAAPAAPTLADRVVQWQAVHGRHHLPWQQTRDPYRVWLSEVMLQQTQVVTVLGYYERFLARFPDVQALAQAPLDDVLALWSGLGYYSRARNLHRCAQAVMGEHGGQFPARSEILATLPGIGRSTAAAIAAFCFGERVAILDGNVKRVLSRALGFDGDLSLAAQEKALWARAQELLPDAGVEAYTQGLMDLGADVCSTRSPRCSDCPLGEMCVAAIDGRPEAYPVKSRRLKRSTRAHTLLWLRHRGRSWLVQRPDQGVWAGLWSLPEWGDAQALATLVEPWPGSGQVLPTVRHTLTHFDWALHPLCWDLPPRAPAAAMRRVEAALPPGRWFTTEEALALGLPAPIRKLISVELQR